MTKFEPKYYKSFKWYMCLLGVGCVRFWESERKQTKREIPLVYADHDSQHEFMKERLLPGCSSI